MIENMNNAMNEEELDKVNGGVVASGHNSETNSQDKTDAFEKHKCKFCKKKTVFQMYSGGRGQCTVCGNPL